MTILICKGTYVLPFTQHSCNDPEIDKMLKFTPDDYIFCGILDVLGNSFSQDNLCHVDFRFLSNPGKLHIKKYQGILTISRIRNVVFIQLQNNEEGEISYLIAEKKKVEVPLLLYNVPWQWF